MSSISAFVSALLLPALCLMCAPCILTVVDFSAYGRSDSTRRPSLAALSKRRPGQGGGGGKLVGAGWAWREGVWIAMMMTMSAMASLVFCKLRCCGCLRNLWERISCFAKKSTELICRTNCYVLNIQRLQFFYFFWQEKKTKTIELKMCFNCLWIEMDLKYSSCS